MLDCKVHLYQSKKKEALNPLLAFRWTSSPSCITTDYEPTAPLHNSRRPGTQGSAITTLMLVLLIIRN